MRWLLFVLLVGCASHPRWPAPGVAPEAPFEPVPNRPTRSFVTFDDFAVDGMLLGKIGRVTMVLIEYQGQVRVAGYPPRNKGTTFASAVLPGMSGSCLVAVRSDHDRIVLEYGGSPEECARNLVPLPPVYDPYRRSLVVDLRTGEVSQPPRTFSQL